MFEHLFESYRNTGKRCDVKALQVFSCDQEDCQVSVERNQSNALVASNRSSHLAGCCSQSGRADGCIHYSDVPYLSKPGHYVNKDKIESGDNSNTPHVSARMRLDDSHDSGFSSENTMYNISSQRIPNYETSDQLRSSAIPESGVLFPLQSHLFHPSGPQTTHYRFGTWNESSQYKSPGACLSNLHYGSLDRKRQNYRCVFSKDVSPMRCAYLHSEFNSEMDKRGLQRERENRNVTSSARFCESSKNSTSHEVPGNSSAFHESFSWDKRAVADVGKSTKDIDLRVSFNNVQGEEMSEDGDVSFNCSKDQFPGSTYQTILRPKLLTTEKSETPGPIQQLFPHKFREQHQRPMPPSVFDRQESSLHQQKLRQGQLSLTSPTRPYRSWINKPQIQDSPQRTYAMSCSDSQRTTNKQQPHVTPPLPLERHSRHSEPLSHVVSTLVTVTRPLPHKEVTKRYELSDFYRYSERLRRQRCVDQYRRQLIGASHTSRLSSSKSLDNDNLSRQSAYRSISSSQSRVTSSPLDRDTAYSDSPRTKQAFRESRDPRHPYIRSSSAPLSPIQSIYRCNNLPSSSTYQNYLRSPSSYCSPTSNLPERHTNIQFAFQTPLRTNTQLGFRSSASNHQSLYSSTKHSVYKPPHVMTCKPLKTPPTNQSDGHMR